MRGGRRRGARVCGIYDTRLLRRRNSRRGRRDLDRRVSDRHGIPSDRRNRVLARHGVDVCRRHGTRRATDSLRPRRGRGAPRACARSPVALRHGRLRLRHGLYGDRSRNLGGDKDRSICLRSSRRRAGHCGSRFQSGVSGGGYARDTLRQLRRAANRLLRRPSEYSSTHEAFGNAGI